MALLSRHRACSLSCPSSDPCKVKLLSVRPLAPASARFTLLQATDLASSMSGPPVQPPL